MEWPTTERYITMPKYLHICVSYHKSLEAYPAILEFTPYIIGLGISGTFYVMIIRALSNRTVANTNTSHQVTQIRNKIARLLVINGVVFYVPSRIANLDNIAGNLFGEPFLS